MVELNRDSCLETYQDVAADLAGSGERWLQRVRGQAIEAFAALGVPTVGHEDWKYTDLRPVTRRRYTLAATGAEDGITANRVEGLGGPLMVLVNGRHDAGRSRPGELPQGVRLESLAAVIGAGDGLAADHLGRAAPERGHGLTALNTAFAEDGAVVQVAAGADAGAPIEILYAATGAGDAPLVQPRNLLILEEGASARVVLRFVGDSGAEYLTNVVTECFLAKGASLELTVIQEEGEKAGHIGGVFVRQQDDSRCVVNTVSLDGLLIRNDLRAMLDAPGARCHLNGLALGNGRQHIDNHTQVDHNVERCISRELYKSILDGRARSVFHGRIVVQEGAQQTDSEQQNQNLLLSRDAEVDTKPQLEIYADDVKCSHGATVGQIDENSVFYLRSRGIGEDVARALLTYAFAEQAVAEVGDGPLRAHVDAAISRKLGTAF